jgi:hypothetical protein
MGFWVVFTTVLVVLHLAKPLHFATFKYFLAFGSGFATAIRLL